MMKLINKDAVMAEIDRRLNDLANTSTEGNKEFASTIGAQHYELMKLAQYINTLEEKEEDIEYVRKDVFIEKAIEWIDYYNQNGGCEFDGWEEDFRIEMEETKEWEKDFR